MPSIGKETEKTEITVQGKEKYFLERPSQVIRMKVFFSHRVFIKIVIKKVCQTQSCILSEGNLFLSSLESKIY